MTKKKEMKWVKSGMATPLLLLITHLSVTTAYISSRLLYNGDNYLTTEEHWFNQSLDHFSPFFQYGNPDKLCSPLVKAKKANQDLVAVYASYVKDFYIENFGASVETYSQEHLKNSTVGEDSDDRLWWFQVCSEVAYFQVAPENDGIRSSKIDTRYHLDLCRNVFGGNVYPEVEATNLYYGGLQIAGSKIVFANGSQDPWRRASKQISSPGMPSYLITCHNCGHCSDVRGCPQSPVSIAGDSRGCSSPDAVNKIRQHITEHIDLWLSECQDVGGYWSAMKPQTLRSS